MCFIAQFFFLFSVHCYQSFRKGVKMFFTIKRFFWILFWGTFGFALSILVLVLNKLIAYNITSSSSGVKSDFTTTALYIMSNKLTSEDFILAFFGFLLTAFLVLLSSRRYY